MEYYVTNKNGVFQRTFDLMGKKFTFKGEKNLDAIFHIQCYLHEIYVFAQEEKNMHFFVKIGHVLFTAVYAALKIVLNQYLLSEYFHN